MASGRLEEGLVLEVREESDLPRKREAGLQTADQGLETRSEVVPEDPVYEDEAAYGDKREREHGLTSTARIV